MGKYRGSEISGKLSARTTLSVSSSKGHQNHHTEAEQSWLAIPTSQAQAFSMMHYGGAGSQAVSIGECYRGLPGCEFVRGDFGRGFMEAGVSSGLDAIGK